MNHNKISYLKTAEDPPITPIDDLKLTIEKLADDHKDNPNINGTVMPELSVNESDAEHVPKGLLIAVKPYFKYPEHPSTQGIVATISIRAQGINIAKVTNFQQLVVKYRLRKVNKIDKNNVREFLLFERKKHTEINDDPLRSQWERVSDEDEISYLCDLIKKMDIVE